METEPTLTYQVFDIILQIIVFIVVMGVGITFLAFLNRIFDFLFQPRPMSPVVQKILKR